MHLYPIQQEHLQIMQAIEDAGGEITPEVEQALQLTNEQFNEQAASIGFLVKSMEDDEFLIEQEIQRLTELAYRIGKRKAWFKSQLSQAMLQMGVEKVKTPTLKLFFRKAESVHTNEYLTDDWKREVKKSEPDLPRIKAALKAGEQVPGASIIVNHHLQIK